jgi:hypothetical protein
MITLEKGDRLFSDNNLVVHQGGEFKNWDLVLVSNINDIENPIYQFQAIYVKEGINND